MQGVCINTGLSNILKKDQQYYLFEHGPNNFYVSKFNNPKSHCGSFARNHFKLVEEQPKKLQRFIAKVAMYHSWYRVGDQYIISEVDKNGYFHVWLKDKPHRGPIGSYLTNFFEIVEPFVDGVIEVAQEKSQEPITEVSTPKVRIVSITVKKDRKKNQAQPGDVKKAKKVVPDGQMDIFDFLLEG